MILLSPAKTQRFSGSVSHATTPSLFPDHTAAVARVLKGQRSDEIATLMKISGSLLEATYKALQQWQLSAVNPVNAGLFVYSGEVFKALDPDTLKESERLWAAKNLSILSALYGIVETTTAVMPYRVEMGCSLKIDSQSLAQFWKPIITWFIKEVLQPSIIFNLASVEYSKVAIVKDLGIPVCTPLFRVRKDGALKNMAIYAKRGRGLLARYIIQNRVSTVPELEKFEAGGFSFDGYEKGELRFVREA